MDMLVLPFLVYCVVFTLYSTQTWFYLFGFLVLVRAIAIEVAPQKEKRDEKKELGLFLYRTSETLLSHLPRSIDRLAGGLCIDFC